MARSSASAAPRPSPLRPRPVSGQSPLQLELFSGAGKRSSPEAAPRPPLQGVPRPADPGAAQNELLRRINRLAGGRLCSLAFTDNRRTILSMRPTRRPGGVAAPLALRIHRSFLAAPDDVVAAVAMFVESKKGSEKAREALRVIRLHFAAGRVEAVPGKRPSLTPHGTALDLREVAEQLNQAYFGGRLRVDVTWGKATGTAGHCVPRARTATLQLGSYSYEDRLVRIHRTLDSPQVPRYVVESVVYHELLHADLPPVVRNGRRYFHTPEFRRRERQFRHFERADRWVKEHLHELLRARQGRQAPRRR